MTTASVTSLEATTGRELGTRTSGRMRVAGRTPAVVYGKGMESISISVDSRELRGALNGPEGIKPVLDLTVDGKKHKVKVHQVQKHPVRHNVIHIDFLVVA